MKISIIIPAYNAEDNLDRCVESILTQSYSDLEIIIVNDGSTDSTSKICDELNRKDARIKVIHQQNHGQSHARNEALKIATGDVITFVDSDDWIVKDLYEHLVQLMHEHDCDVVDFQLVTVEEPTFELKDSREQYQIEKVEGRNEILFDYLYKGQTQKAPFTVWRKLYKKELFSNVRFIEGMINEDIVINFELLMNCTSLIHTDKVGYFYFQSSKSTTRNGLRKRDFDLLKACELLKNLGEKVNDERIMHLIDVKYARSYFSLLAKVAFYGIEDKDINKSDTIKMLTKQLRSNFSLLMKSPIPTNRKFMIVALAANYNLLAMPLAFYKKIKNS